MVKLIIYFHIDILAPPPPTPLSTSQTSSTSTLFHPTFTNFPVSPTSTANTPSSVDNQSSTSTPPIASNPSHSSTESSCQPNIPNDLLCELFNCKMKVVIKDCYVVVWKSIFLH